MRGLVRLVNRKRTVNSYTSIARFVLLSSVACVEYTFNLYSLLYTKKPQEGIVVVILHLHFF